MCGFAGFTESGLKGEDRINVIRRMTDAIIHRGPDEQGMYTDGFVTLGFARLKIIDLTHGKQPMLSKCGRYVLCFNGEIYNYKELRAVLSNEYGVRFFTESDTEVLLNACIVYGERVLERLRGMFAFVFYDRETQKLFLARDPFGIKPLYYGVFDGCFMFASEIKALLDHPQFKKEFDPDVIAYYLQFQYVPTENTAFKNVKRLMPGHLLRYDGTDVATERYFDPPIYGRKGYIPYSFFSIRDGKKRKPVPYVKNVRKAVNEIRCAVKKSVCAHLSADVEVGAFLSGGVDSGYITAIAKPQRAFTVGFPSYGFDEREIAVHTAEKLGTALSSVEADAEDFFECIEDVQYHCDEPYANLSAVPLYILSRKAKEKVGVVLSGEGADELFGGYEWYFDSVLGKVYRVLPRGLRRRFGGIGGNGRIGEFLKRNDGDARKEFIGQAKIMDANTAASLLKEPYKCVNEPYGLTREHYSAVKGASLLKSKMYLDRCLWLPFDILSKADRMTMASSLELRVPYLDLEVLNIAQSLSDRLLVRGKVGKYAFRVAASEQLGKENAFRKKKGFPVPLREWIREKKYADILRSSFLGAIGRRFFETDKLLSMLDAHVSGSENNARILYTVYVFIKWYEIFFSDEKFIPARGADKLMNDTVLNTKVKYKEKQYEKMVGDNTGL